MNNQILALALLAMALPGCASLQYAGNASYSVKPFTDSKGAVICCEVNVINGKEIANLEAHISKTAAGDYTVNLKEQGVAAFQGQAIAASVASDAAKTATTAAIVTGGVLIAPVAAPAIAGLAASGSLGTAAVGAGAAIIVDKVKATEESK